MKINCTSCGHEVNLGHGVFKDYAGPVKCFCCGEMLEVKIASGFVYSINPLATLNGQASDNLVENPKFTSE